MLVKKYRFFFSCAVVFLLAVISPLVIISYIANRPIQAASESMGPFDYYFAYGSNMSTRYITNVRGVVVYESYAGYVEGYTVKFSLSGINFLEPSFAKLEIADNEIAYGVLHRIKVDDFQKIGSSESESYTWKSLRIKRDNGNEIFAKTLIANGDITDVEHIPSKCYLDILIEGSREHQLPLKRILKLQSYEGIYVFGLSEIMGTVIHGVVMINSKP